jgi:hypothetical protein
LAAADPGLGAVSGLGGVVSEMQALGTRREIGRFETHMIYAGILITLLGFAISIFSLGIVSSVGARLAIVLIGLAVSLFGIMGVINRAYLKNAIWRRQS